MIDRHYGHLATDGRQHAINLLGAHTRASVHAVDARRTHNKSSPAATSPETGG